VAEAGIKLRPTLLLGLTVEAASLLGTEQPGVQWTVTHWRVKAQGMSLANIDRSMVDTKDLMSVFPWNSLAESLPPKQWC
jgi:hypothetical protein